MQTDEFFELHKRIVELEKRVEKYYRMLKIKDELDFIIKGTYYLDSELNDLLQGNY